MAVLDHLPSVEVTISCNGITVDEYADDQDDVRQAWKPKTASKYIESVSDSEFFIQLQVGSSYEFAHDSLCFDIIMDGDEQVVDGYFCHPDDFVGGIWAHEAEGREVLTNRGSMMRKYKFASLKITDKYPDGLSTEQKDQMAKIGLIEVRVYEMAKSRKSKAPVQKKTKRSWDMIPETVLKGKAISHRIAYGDETVVESPSDYRVPNYVNGWDDPVGVFRFKYRSRDDLEKHWIMPRTVSPEEQVRRFRTFDSLTAREQRQWARLKFEEMRIVAEAALEMTDQTQSSMFIQVFEDLNEDEIRELAQQKYAELLRAAQMTIKQEPAIKEENGGQRSNDSLDALLFKAKQYNWIAIANGEMAIDLTEDSADEGEDDDDCVEIPTVSEASSTSTRTIFDIEASEMVEEGQKLSNDAVTDTEIPVDVVVTPTRIEASEAVEGGHTPIADTSTDIDIPIDVVVASISSPAQSATAAPPQPTVATDEMAESPVTAATTYDSENATSPVQMTQTGQPAQSDQLASPSPTNGSETPLSRSDVSTDEEGADVRATKRRKIRGLSKGMVGSGNETEDVTVKETRRRLRRRRRRV